MLTNREAEGQVCLLIDFENLVYGLSSQHTENLPDVLDVKLLVDFASDHGRVVLGNAYADWRSSAVNQFQVDLYRVGVDLVHVVGRRLKNAVDVKMAVDAIETIWTLPRIETYVIVSGDRDFIHVLKTLRRYGKTVVGVAPDGSVSDDFAALCDRFVKYSNLASTQEVAQSSANIHADLGLVKEALRTILADHSVEGLHGAKVKPLLRRHLSPSFDESEFGFAKMSAFLRSMPDVVRVHHDGGQVDFMAFPASGGEPTDGHSSEPSATSIVRSAALRDYRFEQSVERRRAILGSLHSAWCELAPATKREVLEHVLENTEDPALSITVLSKYHQVLWHGQSFELEPGSPGADRPMRLRTRFQSPTAFIELYEKGITHKVIRHSPKVTPQVLADVLGLNHDDAEELEYCRALIDRITAQ